MNFTGISAFPLTPIGVDGIDVISFNKIIDRLVKAKVDSIGLLGSTGSYAYLSVQERANITLLALERSQEIPVMVGIGALTTRDVASLAEQAQKAGAAALMLAPVSYHKLTEDEVFGLYRDITLSLSIPLCVYDNPGTTNFKFSDDLYCRIAELPNVGSIKIPPFSLNEAEAKQRISHLKKILPSHMKLGISGDWTGVAGLKAGCDVWYSGFAGLLPEPFVEMVRATRHKNFQIAEKLAADFEIIWELCRKHGTVRVIATAAEILGIVDYFCLPPPIKSINEDKLVLMSILQEMEIS